jgi:hypothetical protein
MVVANKSGTVPIVGLPGDGQELARDECELS